MYVIFALLSKAFIHEKSNSIQGYFSEGGHFEAGIKV